MEILLYCSGLKRFQAALIVFQQDLTMPEISSTLNPVTCGIFCCTSVI